MSNFAPSRFEWRIHHKESSDKEPLVVVEVSPLIPLFPRWRFVLPASYPKLVKWGVGGPNLSSDIREDIRNKTTSNGPVQLVDGPKVVWFGALEPLSKKLSAYLVFEGEPPHYIMFGQGESSDAPPTKLEGITFGAQNHHAHAKQVKN